MALGELRLVLRNVEDDDPARTKGARPADVLRGSASGDVKIGDDDPTKDPTASPVTAPKVPDVPTAPAVDEKKPEAPKPPKTHTLTVINGGNVTRAVFVMDKPDGEKDTQIDKSETPEKPAAVAPPKDEKEKAPEKASEPAANGEPTPPATKGQDQ
jgi:hypothetical protein